MPKRRIPHAALRYKTVGRDSGRDGKRLESEQAKCQKTGSAEEERLPAQEL